MSVATPNLPILWTEEEHEALSSRGLAIYEEKLRPILEPQYDKKSIAIHVETEDYEVADSTGDAMRAIRKRHPEGFLLMMKIGNEPEWGLAMRLLGLWGPARRSSFSPYETAAP